MICSFCSAKIPEGEKNCPACGAAVALADAIPTPSPYYREMIGDADPNEIPEAPEVLDSLPPVPILAEPAKYEVPQPVIELSTEINDRSNWAVASLVLGLLGLGGFVAPILCTLVTSLPAVILGAMSLSSRRKTTAITGIILGVIGFVLMIGSIIGLFALAAWSSSFFQN